MSFLFEIFRFLAARRKYWLWPMMLTIILIGGAVVLTQGTAVAPFIYTLF